MIKINIKSFLEYLSVLLIILTSGSICYYKTLSPNISIVFFILFSIYFYCKHKIKRSNNFSFLYIIIFTLLITISLLLNGNLADNQSFGHILQAIGSYFIISNFNFYRFRQILLNITTLICILSIIVFTLSEFNLITPSIHPKGTFLTYAGITLGWDTGLFHRLAGIFHEPGAFQILLNIILILFLKEISYWQLNKSEKLKLTVIIIALILTKSTGGYLASMTILTCALYRKMKSKWFIPIVGILILVVTFTLNTDVVQKKINPEEGKSISLQDRIMDNIAMLQMTTERPIIGYGLGSQNYVKRSIQVGNISSSNGILYITSSIGILWLFLFLFFTYKAIKKLHVDAPIIILIAAYFMLQCNERFIEHPISYILLLQYGSYQLPKVFEHHHKTQ